MAAPIVKASAARPALLGALLKEKKMLEKHPNLYITLVFAFGIIGLGLVDYFL